MALLPGQTLLLSGSGAGPDRTNGRIPILADRPEPVPFLRSDWPTDPDHYLIVLVTPTLLDPAGNPLHVPDPDLTRIAPQP